MPDNENPIMATTPPPADSLGGYALGTWEQKPGQRGMSVRIAREISDAEFDRHIEAIDTYEALVERSAFELIQRSFFNIRTMIESLANVERFGGDFRRAQRGPVNKSVMAEVTNWLAATRLYLENERDFILNAFGEKSAEMIAYKAATSGAFDSHDGYRFLYNLRDYTQHCGIPSGYLDISGSAPNRRIVLSLDRSRLLTARFKWSKHAKALLNTWPEKIPLVPLMEDAMEGYATVEEQMLRIILRRCINFSPILIKSIESLNGMSGNAALFRLPRSADAHGNINFSVRTFPDQDSLVAILAASETEDPFAELCIEEPSPPPSLPTDGTRASALLSTFLMGDLEETGRVINLILQRDGEVGPLVSDLVNTSAVLVHMLSELLGAPPHALLGNLGHIASED
ncbi:hypothetical protein [Yinghuangia soli]|uniref:Uncharacterized protein n=1 Tax=Yinghuangia soli TaxID=2908204 RepID=A0AA41PVG5_9ACTN|nr:hypothetical protein [Yinghuangia soli]MCF2526600.1 hypothetical protein [Yinghuangia soli]